MISTDDTNYFCESTSEHSSLLRINPSQVFQGKYITSKAGSEILT